MFSQSDKVPYDLTKYEVVKYYNSIDRSKSIEANDNSRFEYKVDFGENWRYDTWFFNQNGFVVGFRSISRNINNQWNISLTPYRNFKNVTYQLRNQIPRNEYSQLDIREGIWNKYNSYIINKTTANNRLVVTEIYRVKTKKDILSTYFGTNERGQRIDLREERMKYNIEDYLYAFLYDVSMPWLTMGTDYVFGEFDIEPLNNEDSELLKLIWNNKNERIKLEFTSLEEGVLGLAIGNIFDDGILNIKIDRNQFIQASPSKRAYIIWHEGYHTLGLEHGQCSDLMNPYIKNYNYTWNEWNKLRKETIICWTNKRNSLESLVYNNVYEGFDSKKATDELKRIKKLYDNFEISSDNYERRRRVLRKIIRENPASTSSTSSESLVYSHIYAGFDSLKAMDELKRIKSLLDNGDISKYIYERRKKVLLNIIRETPHNTKN